MCMSVLKFDRRCSYLGKERFWGSETAYQQSLHMCKTGSHQITNTHSHSFRCTTAIVNTRRHKREMEDSARSVIFVFFGRQKKKRRFVISSTVLLWQRINILGSICITCTGKLMRSKSTTNVNVDIQFIPTSAADFHITSQRMSSRRTNQMNHIS